MKARSLTEEVIARLFSNDSFSNDSLSDSAESNTEAVACAVAAESSNNSDEDTVI